MSLLWVLRKYVDSNKQREEQEDLRRQREDWPPDVNPSDADVVVPTRIDADVRYRCRVCGHEGDEHPFCPTCLAETMLPLKS
jgi:lipopolysaccharide biosynthesis regulator YciM